MRAPLARETPIYCVSPMEEHVLGARKKLYPEMAFGGFTRLDGTIRFCSRVQALLPESGTVLDVGCGRASRQADPSPYRAGLQDFRAPGRTVIGIDVDPGASDNPFVDEFRLIDDTERWPVESDSVDLIYSDYVLEHVDDPVTFFREVARVTRAGGYACFRTPNAWSYISLAARLVPNRRHADVVSKVSTQSEREERDVFPTVYRANRPRTIRKLLDEAGFDSVVFAMESEPGYLDFSSLAYRLGALLHAVLPPAFQSTLVAFACKRAG